MFVRDVVVSLYFCALCTLIMDGSVATEHRRRNLRHLTSQFKKRQRIGNDNHHGMQNSKRSLIVGGKDATQYPGSIVFLSDRIDDLSCGGTLISPTIVLTSGHCEVSLVTHAVFGRYDHPEDRRDSTGKFANSDREIRIPIKQEILHPDYDDISLTFDVMLLVLEISPNDHSFAEVTEKIPYMRLHSPSDISIDHIADSLASPNGGGIWNGAGPEQTNLPLKAVGWGYNVDPTDDDILPTPKSTETLQEVTLNYVRNEVCRNVEDKVDNSQKYRYRITDDMMCTYAKDRDTCNGDSGGPIMIPNPNPNPSPGEHRFIQVGIISWGEDCADHAYPGVGSRIASSYDWIRDRVCSIDGASAPNEFGCVLGDEHTFSPVPSASPTTDEDKLVASVNLDALSMLDFRSGDPSDVQVKVAIEIFLDVFAKETSWSLVETNTGISVMRISEKTYQHEDRTKHEVVLTEGISYTFNIKDAFGDGITQLGFYRIYVIDETKENDIGRLLVKGLGKDFEFERSHTFVVNSPATPNPVSSRPSPSPSTPTPTATFDENTPIESGSISKRQFHERFGILKDVP